jgi:uncharacterized membrane protein
MGTAFGMETQMKEWLIFIAGSAVTVIHAMALFIVIVGTIEAFLRSIRALVRPKEGSRAFYDTYLRYARCLVGALTFQLAADIIESALAPTWDEIGRLGAIAVIRTFLNYFLERDMAELEKREAESESESEGTKTRPPQDQRS